MFKKTIISLVIIPLFFSTIFCCCVEDFAFASTSPEIEHCHSDADSDQQDSPQEHDSQKPHDCQCLKVLNLSNQLLTLKYIPPVVYNVDFHPTMIGFIQHIALKPQVFLSFHSPPVLKAASTPIYLKHSVLRL